MSPKVKKILLGGYLVLAVLWFAQDEYFRHLKTLRAEKAEKRAEKELLSGSIASYLKCVGPACDNLYPDAALAVKKAEAEVRAEQNKK